MGTTQATTLLEDIEAKAGNITYVTTGQLKQHLIQIVTQIRGTDSSALEGSEEAFRKNVLARLVQAEADINEVAAGVNAIYKALRDGGVIRSA